MMDLPPPLEDFSNNKRLPKAKRSNVVPVPVSEMPITAISSDDADHTNELSMMDQMIAASNSARKKIAVKKEKEITKGFGEGMKLGGAFQKKKSSNSTPAVASDDSSKKLCSGPDCDVVSMNGKVKMSKCSRCKVVWYCSRPCQMKHWKAGHRRECGKPVAATTVEARTKASVSVNDDIIRPKNPGAKKDDGLRIPEVQDAMADQMSNLMSRKNEWMTPKLMEKFARNPVLAKGLADPRCTAALQEFQANPAAASKKYANVPGINDFFKAYFSIMGEHLTKLGAEQEKKAAAEQAKAAAAAAPVIETAKEKAERLKIEKILSDPVLKRILEDPDMKRVLTECSFPGKLQEYLKHPVYGDKIRKMAKAGLVQIHPE